MWNARESQFRSCFSELRVSIGPSNIESPENVPIFQSALFCHKPRRPSRLVLWSSSMARPRFESNRLELAVMVRSWAAVWTFHLGNFNVLAVINKLEPLTGFSKLLNPESKTPVLWICYSRLSVVRLDHRMSEPPWLCLRTTQKNDNHTLSTIVIIILTWCSALDYLAVAIMFYPCFWKRSCSRRTIQNRDHICRSCNANMKYTLTYATIDSQPGSFVTLVRTSRE